MRNEHHRMRQILLMQQDSVVTTLRHEARNAISSREDFSFLEQSG